MHLVTVDELARLAAVFAAALAMLIVLGWLLGAAATWIALELEAAAELEQLERDAGRL